MKLKQDSQRKNALFTQSESIGFPDQLRFSHDIFLLESLIVIVRATVLYFKGQGFGL